MWRNPSGLIIPPYTGAEQQIELRQAIQGLPPDGGAWTGPKIAQWMAAKTGKPVHRQRGLEYLRRLAASTAAEGSLGDQAHL
jgi:hypothetical protein